MIVIIVPAVIVKNIAIVGSSVGMLLWYDYALTIIVVTFLRYIYCYDAITVTITICLCF